MTKVLSKAQRKYLQNYIEEIQPELGLWDWDVSVQQGKCGKHAIAETYLVHSNNTAHVRFSHEFIGSNRNKQRETIVHELLHACLRDISTATEGLDDKHWEHIFERSVDRLARGVAQFFPEVVLP